jgi:DNA-binding transcriptional MerR regulator/DNA-directed RNA polymerase subunit RPC12/RpoP
MKELITTGELAKLCEVSVRTVQFYDKKGLLKPSLLSEGGRRMFGEEEVIKLRYISLYKELGFSLEEIKEVFDNNSNIDLFKELLKQQEDKISKEISNLKERQQKLKAILQEVDESNTVKIKSIEGLNHLIEKKIKYKKVGVMTNIFLSIYVLILIGGFSISVSLGNYAVWIFVAIAVLLLMGLVYYHQQANAYVCLYCNKKFEISFVKDLFSLNGGKKGKYIKCPNCNKKGWFKETFPEK